MRVVSHEPSAVAIAGAPISCVVTRMRVAAPRAQVWDALELFEELEGRPPVHLRLVLPIPIGTEGPKAAVGGEVVCRYQGGHLRKRITRFGRALGVYEFEISEQRLAVPGGVRLVGGGYALRELPGGRTEVAVETRYVSPRRPRWLWRPFERAVGHAFHRHLLRSLRRKVASRAAQCPS